MPQPDAGGEGYKVEDRRKRDMGGGASNRLRSAGRATEAEATAECAIARKPCAATRPRSPRGIGHAFCQGRPSFGQATNATQNTKSYCI